MLFYWYDISIHNLKAMPRQGRIPSGTGVYDVMMRGMNKQQAFHTLSFKGRKQNRPLWQHVMWFYFWWRGVRGESCHKTALSETNGRRGGRTCLNISPRIAASSGGAKKCHYRPLSAIKCHFWPLSAKMWKMSFACVVYLHRDLTEAFSVRFSFDVR